VSTDTRRKASANLFQKWHALSRSVWTAPYSGALTSGAPLCQQFCNGFAEALLPDAGPVAPSPFSWLRLVRQGNRSKVCLMHPINAEKGWRRELAGDWFSAFRRAGEQPVEEANDPKV